MFKLHDKTRRLLTLLIYLLLGPALLLAVLTKVYTRHSVATVAEWEVLFSNSLGLPVEIERVSFPSPGVVRFLQVRVFDAETNGEVLLQIPQWELYECFGEMPRQIDPVLLPQADEQGDDDQNGNIQNGNMSPNERATTFFYDATKSRTPYKRGMFASVGFACSSLFGKKPSYWHCEIPKVTCYDTAIPQAKDALLELTAKQPAPQTNRKQTGVGSKPMVLYVGSIDIFFKNGDSGDMTLSADSFLNSQMQKADCLTIRNACFEFRPVEEQTTFLATFLPANQPSDVQSSDMQPFRLAVSHRRSLTTMTCVQFASGDNEVPNRLLVSLDPFFGSFGRDSRFKGTALSENSVDKHKNRTRSLELSQAAFFDVSLDSLLNKSFTFRFDGTADRLTLDSAKFRNESNDGDALRLESALGSIINAKGLASWPGLRQLVRGTKLQILPGNASPPETDITFCDGTFAFLIDTKGIQLSPALDPSRQRMPLFVVVNHCAVFWPTPGYVIEYAELLAALAKPNTRQIPLMSETQHLISTLPIPVEQDARAISEPSRQESQQVRLIEAVTVMPEPQFQPPAPINNMLPSQQPPMASQDNASSIFPVPQLMSAPPQEQYRQQQHLAMGNVTRQPDTPATTQRPLQNDSYSHQPRTDESPFLMLQPDTTDRTTPAYYASSSNGNPAASQPNVPQPNGVPYNNNSPFIAASQPQNRVMISSIGGLSNQVQTNSILAAGSFNSDAPTFDPYQHQTQVASVPQSQSQPQPQYRNYDTTPTMMPSASQYTMPTSTPSAMPPAMPMPSSQFGLRETNSRP